MLKTKYIITQQGNIIIFSDCQKHIEFSDYAPISAGFISFGVNKEGEATCSCYGESTSLRLKARPEEDTRIAKRQLGLLY